MIAASFELQGYEPETPAPWDNAFERMLELDA
jgi:hypothetical protein